jgi:hypothetical protein
MYPPGLFEAWNQAPGPADNGYEGDAWGHQATAGYPMPGHPEAGHDVSYSDRGYADPGYAPPSEPEADYPGFSDPGYADVGYPPAGYSALAVSDPAADVTSTQGWQAVVDEPAAGWPNLPGGVDDPHQAAGPAGLAARAGLAGPGLGPGLVTGPQPPFGTGPHEPFGHEPEQPFDTGDGQRVDTGPHQPFRDGPDQPFSTGPIGRVDEDFEPPPRRDPDQRRDRSAPGPGTRPGQVPRGPGGGSRGRGSRGKARPKGAGRARILIASTVALVVLVAGAAYLLFTGGHQQPSSPTASQANSSPRPSPSPSPTPSLGPWGHIESRALDPTPLGLAELFPATFADGTDTYTMTVDKAKAKCSAELVGSSLIAAVDKASCTQVMRASYLSASPRLMGTIGVLNLVTAAAAEKAGKAAGPSEFIAQLAGPAKPTKNLTKGTGFEAAEVKGHYLVLVWAEFTNLKAPTTTAQKTELEAFISTLMQKTVNVSLANRQVTGSPPPA